MPNTLLTPEVIAMEALAILRNNLVMADLVHKDYANEFVKVGDTITVRKPATLVAKDFEGNISKQDLSEEGIPVKLDRFKDISVSLTSKQETLELKDFSKQVIEPAMVALANQIDEDLYSFVFSEAGNQVGALNDTPTNLKDIADVAKIMDIKKAPMTDRHFVMSPHHKYRYALTENLSKVNYAGTNATLRDALLGKIYTMQTYMDQNAVTSNSLTDGTQKGTVKVTGTKGASTVALAELALATGTLKIGEGFVYKGIQYRFTEDKSASSNAVASIAIAPALKEDIAGVVVPLIHKASSVAFHRNAFTFVIRPLDLPMGAARASVANGEGLSVRVVYGYDQDTKTDTISFDVIYGVSTLRSDLAVRLVDNF